MAVVGTDQLTDTIQNLKQAADAALGAETVQQLCDFEKYLSEVEAFVRETQQSMWATEAKATIKALEKGQPLSEIDKDVIRTFLVSDAERYLEHENNYGDWKRELTRLMNELVKRANMVDRDSIGDMRGILKDAIRLVPDIRNYADERERVKKFGQAVDAVDDASRAILVRLLKEQLTSPNR